MENNQPKKISAGLTAVIVLLLVITTIASCLGIYAWAKYITRLPDGQTTAQVAKWHFELRNGTSQVESGKQLLALTRTDGYGHVVTGELAPGTFGEFLLEIDTTGTEVTLVYDVDITLEDCPVNLIFYKDSAHTQVLEKEAVSEGVVKLHWSKYLSLDSTADNYVNKVHLEKIYWNWPYETLDANNSAAAGDAQDKLDNGKEVQMNIVVTGTEVLSEPNSNQNSGSQQEPEDDGGPTIVGGPVLTGETVAYTPPTNVSIATSDLPAGATLTQNISTSDVSNWKILDYNSTTGEVRIIPTTYNNKKLTLEGMDGYNNAIEAIDAVAAIYLNPVYAKSSKGLTIEDVNAIEEYDPTDPENAVNTQGGIFLTDNIFSDEKKWNHIYGMNENLDIIDYKAVAERTYTVNRNTIIYEYGLDSSILNWDCWLASRCVGLYDNYITFNVRYLYDNFVNGNTYLFEVDRDGSFSTQDDSQYVTPVVTLKSSVTMVKDSNGVWQLSVQ